MMLSSLLLLLALSQLATSSPSSSSLQARSARCTDLVFTVNGAAQNKELSGINLSNSTELLATLMDDVFTLVPVQGSQSLAGTFCRPSISNHNHGQLQVLFHGITSNRGYWDALAAAGFEAYESDAYSWVDVANAAGYPTLALDRLGAGKSSHPDPVLVVQGPYEYALYHDLATQIRAGTAGLPTAYNNLVYVGHSYGSVIGNNMAHLFPKDFDSMILTGFSKSVLPSLIGVTLQTPIPAAVENPAEFGNLSVGYLTAPNESTHTDSFFGSHAQANFASEAANQFWIREDVVSVGQFVSTYTDITGAPEYTGRLLVLTGEEDQAFCGPGSPTLGEAHCGSLLPDTGSLFPNADYNWYSVAATGHAINFHYSAQSAYAVANEFLAGTSFAG